MTKRVLIYCFLLMMSLSQFLCAGTRNAEKLEVDVCDISVPKEIAQANASFVVVFAVQVDEDGRLIKVDKATNDFLSDVPFVSCMTHWILPRNSRALAVTFTWKHALGWTEIAISGDQVDYRIKFHPDQFRQ
jgi:hypothetical protein